MISDISVLSFLLKFIGGDGSKYLALIPLSLRVPQQPKFVLSFFFTFFFHLNSVADILKVEKLALKLHQMMANSKSSHLFT